MKTPYRRRNLLLVATLLASSFLNTIAHSQTVEWIRQFGSASHDQVYGVSADRLGNIFISGDTLGSLAGPNLGYVDAFVSKYDAHGTLQWTRQLSTAGEDRAVGVSADGSGNVYVTGLTEGGLDGPNLGQADAFLSKYDGAGVLQWTRQLGSARNDRSLAVSANSSGSVYISGFTQGNLDGPNPGGPPDAFVSKFDAAGRLQWTRQWGTRQWEQSLGVVADELGNVYFTGNAEDRPDRQGFDAFLGKYDGDGVLQWTRILRSNRYDGSKAAAVDGLGGIYITGLTNGSLNGPNAGDDDAFLSKYDAAGSLQWTRQLGTFDYDSGDGVLVDHLEHVYITGTTHGSLGGPIAGATDAFISKYDNVGTHLWTRQFGSSDIDYARGISGDGRGNIYISGYTLGSLGGSNMGGFDAFLVKIRVVPEPASAALSIFALAAGGFAPRLRTRE